MKKLIKTFLVTSFTLSLFYVCNFNECSASDDESDSDVEITHREPKKDLKTLMDMRTVMLVLLSACTPHFLESFTEKLSRFRRS